MVTQPCLQMERTMVLRVDVDGQTVILTLARQFNIYSDDISNLMTFRHNLPSPQQPCILQYDNPVLVVLLYP